MPDRILYIEATSGISGDMFLGALLDAGVPVEVFSNTWTALGIENYEVEVFQTQKSGLKALQCRVKTDESKGPRTWKQYKALLERSKLPEKMRATAVGMIEQLFKIEASLHGTTLDRLHLHEMGGTDLLIDITGALAGVEHLRPSVIRASPVNTGRGFITFSHGRLPVPAPATAKLLEGIPVFQNEVEAELTTPTGALLLRTFAQSFGELPAMRLEMTGTGAGEKEIPGHPNVLRILIGTGQSSEADVLLIESNIDDSSPQMLAYFMEKAFEAGALDVFFTPIFMKKNRPAVRLTLLVPAGLMESISRLLFEETTAIGFRYWKVDRKTLERKWSTVRIGKVPVRVKESYLNGELINYQPEYEDCKTAATKLKRPVKQIFSQAISLYLRDLR